jgi:hypothetical protein
MAGTELGVQTESGIHRSKALTASSSSDLVSTTVRPSPLSASWFAVSAECLASASESFCSSSWILVWRASAQRLTFLESRLTFNEDISPEPAAAEGLPPAGIPFACTPLTDDTEGVVFVVGARLALAFTSAGAGVVELPGARAIDLVVVDARSGSGLLVDDETEGRGGGSIDVRVLEGAEMDVRAVEFWRALAVEVDAGVGLRGEEGLEGVAFGVEDVDDSAGLVVEGVGGLVGAGLTEVEVEGLKAVRVLAVVRVDGGGMGSLDVEAAKLERPAALVEAGVARFVGAKDALGTGGLDGAGADFGEGLGEPARYDLSSAWIGIGA